MKLVQPSHDLFPTCLRSIGQDTRFWQSHLRIVQIADAIYARYEESGASDVVDDEGESEVDSEEDEEEAEVSAEGTRFSDPGSLS